MAGHPFSEAMEWQSESATVTSEDVTKIVEIDATIISVIQGKTHERELEKWDMRIVEEREDIVRSIISFNDVTPVIISDIDMKCVGTIGCTSQAGEALEQAEQIGCVSHDDATSGVNSEMGNAGPMATPTRVPPGCLSQRFKGAVSVKIHWGANVVPIGAIGSSFTVRTSQDWLSIESPRLRERYFSKRAKKILLPVCGDIHEFVWRETYDDPAALSYVEKWQAVLFFHVYIFDRIRDQLIAQLQAAQPDVVEVTEGVRNILSRLP